MILDFTSQDPQNAPLFSQDQWDPVSPAAVPKVKAAINPKQPPSVPTLRFGCC